MKKVIFISIFILLFISVFAIFIINRKGDNKIITNKSVNDVTVFKEDNKEDNISSELVAPVENIEIKSKEPTNLVKLDENNKEVIIKKFKDENKIVKNDIPNFIQVSEGEILSDEIKDNQCLLNILYKKSDLSVCDFAKLECDDLECDRYDCLEYSNGWFKVVYYGAFVGSGDRELVARSGDNIVIGNLECGDESLESYENKLFLDLITN